MNLLKDQTEVTKAKKAKVPWTWTYTNTWPAASQLVKSFRLTEHDSCLLDSLLTFTWWQSLNQNVLSTFIIDTDQIEISLPFFQSISPKHTYMSIFFILWNFTTNFLLNLKHYDICLFFCQGLQVSCKLELYPIAAWWQGRGSKAICNHINGARAHTLDNFVL